MTKNERAAKNLLLMAAKLNADPVWTATILKTLKLDRCAKRVIRRLPGGISAGKG
jgi:hypothetical protein